jgi:hypothetical protein
MINHASFSNPNNVVGSYSGSPASLDNPPNFAESPTLFSSNKILIPDGAGTGTACNIQAASSSYNTLKGGGKKNNKTLKYMYGGNKSQTFSKYRGGLGRKGGGYSLGKYTTRKAKIGGCSSCISSNYSRYSASKGGRGVSRRKKNKRLKKRKKSARNKSLQRGGCGGFRVGSVELNADDSMLANPPPISLYK